MTTYQLEELKLGTRVVVLYFLKNVSKQWGSYLSGRVWGGKKMNIKKKKKKITTQIAVLPHL